MVGRTVGAVLRVLSDGVPRSYRNIVVSTGLGLRAVEGCLYRLWRRGLVLRSEKPFMESERVFKGRAGASRNLRKYYLYVIAPKGGGETVVNGIRFVGFTSSRASGRAESKAQIIYRFLEENRDRAFFAREVADLLADRGIRPPDVMSNARRLERRGLVYVRGYRGVGRETPFREGYIITWIDPSKPREQAISEAFERTERILAEKSTPIIQRVQAVRDEVIKALKVGDIVSLEFLREKLGCSEYELEGAVERAKQLYPEIREVKVFERFRYLYHASMPEEALKKAIKAKEDYIRVYGGQRARIGHNWEACVEWFIDKFTTGAEFMTQEHRNKRMDRRRITLQLVKSVAGRFSKAEVDRVWTVNVSPLIKPITYVLECKWGLVGKRDLDEFMEVLRWSKEFGVDTPEGRQIKSSVIGVFAGSAFNEKEKIMLKDGTAIGLPSYAARMNIQLIKASDLNKMLRERGCTYATVQEICRLARDEDEVRRTLDEIWSSPEKEREILKSMAEKNRDIYEFERMLEAKSD
ncbi:MAG: hypothetical protein QXK78_06280 [Candidatus Bathyarchaeia archaeon]